MEASPISTAWLTSPELSRAGLHFDPPVYLAATCHLLVNANLLSTSVYRADVLYDSAGVLADDTRPELARDHHGAPPGFTLERTIARTFIPRNTNRDRPLDQTCRFYTSQDGHLVTYESHVSSELDIPYYHPVLRAWAVLYNTTDGVMSLHFAPFSSGVQHSMPTRLHRTLLNLLDTTVKVTRQSSKTPHPTGTNPKPFKDNLVSQRHVQSTHSRLKLKYAKPLMQNWVEQTEPSKHVFEDIAIAAFLIELWKIMYSPSPDKGNHFPGFVDIACGNGVLVYILLSEGYQGHGFDAHRRKTWSTFPSSVQEQLTECICLPPPFKGALNEIPDTRFNSGTFAKGTFLISNHADELTIWTPLLGALSDPTSPLPFLAIPCCSHSISGNRHRYPPPSSPKTNNEQQNHQPNTGDLRELRALRIEAGQNPGSPTSTYGSLTAKVIDIAEQIGYDIESTILRIPSTRNIGIVGKGLSDRLQQIESLDAGTERNIQSVLERESAREGGLQAAARIWVDHSIGLQRGQGKGKTKGERHHDST